MVCRDGADGDVVAEDVWAAVASAYDVFAVPHEPARRAALDELVPLLRPDCGPILDVGAGSGASVAVVLDRLPTASVVALEPSRAMRSLLLSRIAARTAWFPRVTVRPEDFFSATLPPRLGGAILLGVVGCFDAGERAAVLAELATRLPAGGAALMDLRLPLRPQRVVPRERSVAMLGGLEYREIAEAWPCGTEGMRWRVSYLCLEGERILTEDTVEFDMRHPVPRVVAAEASRVGLTLRPLPGRSHWMLERP